MTQYWTSYPMHGSSQPLVFRHYCKRINCSQSVNMKIWCFKEIWQIYATRDVCWYRFGYSGRPTVWKIILVFWFFENLFSIEYSFKSFYFRVIPFTYKGKNKVYNLDKCRRYTWKICGRHIWPNLAGQISPCLIEDPRGRRFWLLFRSDLL